MSGLSSITNFAGASQTVVNAIKAASQKTGVSFDYLMHKARQESSFNPNAKASTSSATGLFQFIDSTWMQAVKSYGGEFGLGDLAAKISSDGKVADPATRQQILNLRKNPEVAANLTAAMTKDNADFLSTSLGGKVGEADLYMAHFLGLGGANKFLKARQDNPFQAAADLFPAAATANRNVFYDASGRKKSLDQVYDFFAQKMGGEGGASAAPVVNSVVAVKQPSERAPLPIMFNAAGSGFLVSRDVAASQGFSLGELAQRQLYDTLMSGMSSFGFSEEKQGGQRLGQGLLSPYTSLVLASLTTPGENNKGEAGLF